MGKGKRGGGAQDKVRKERKRRGRTRAHDVDIPRDDPWVGIGDSCADESEEGQEIREEHLAVTEEGWQEVRWEERRSTGSLGWSAFYERVHARSA